MSRKNQSMIPTSQLPEQGMKITRFPLSDEEIRLKALELAAQGRARPSETLGVAGQYESYLRYGRREDQNGNLALAPEIFLSEDRQIIVYQNTNFQQVCNQTVTRTENGGSGCALPR